MSWKFNPFTGKLDYFEEVDQVKRLVDSKIAGEEISALKLVYAIDSLSVGVGSSLLYNKSKVIGIAMNHANIGEQVNIHLFGKYEDGLFGFTINEPVFLSQNGSMTQIAPSVLNGDLYSVDVGFSLGLNQVFIRINNPVEL